MHSPVVRTIYKLVNEHEVVLNALFVNLAKVRLGDRVEPVKELENESSICIGPSSCMLVDMIIH